LGIIPASSRFDARFNFHEGLISQAAFLGRSSRAKADGQFLGTLRFGRFNLKLPNNRDGHLQIRVDYKRKGYSFIDLTEKVLKRKICLILQIR